MVDLVTGLLLLLDHLTPEDEVDFIGVILDKEIGRVVF
jgi:hypothetical protein